VETFIDFPLRVISSSIFLSAPTCATRLRSWREGSHSLAPIELRDDIAGLQLRLGRGELGTTSPMTRAIPGLQRLAVRGPAPSEFQDNRE